MAQGNHKNQVIWFNTIKTVDEALDAMDGWLSRVFADTGSADLATKIAHDRPSDLVDLCGKADGTNMTMTECTGVPDGSPRVAAGGPLADDVLQCKLSPLDRSSYGAAFTDSDWARMLSTFPTGVCRYDQAGDGQQATVAWQSYLNSDGSVRYGGAALGAAPTSH